VRRISHCLAARPGATLDGLRRVHSHPVALAQCRLFFERHPWLQPVEAYDTAGAIERLMAGGGPEEAALGSRRAAELYGAVVLAHPVEDRADNFTRFLALVLRS
jgi:prephenate dehydratase